MVKLYLEAVAVATDYEEKDTIMWEESGKLSRSILALSADY